MKKDMYMEALESTLKAQQFEIDELEAQIEYIKSSNDKTENHFKMLAELKQELTEAISDLTSAKQYVESQRQYA